MSICTTVPGSGAADNTAARPEAARPKARTTAARRGASDTEGAPPARGGGMAMSADAAAMSAAAIFGTDDVAHASRGAAKHHDAGAYTRSLFCST